MTDPHLITNPVDQHVMLWGQYLKTVTKQNLLERVLGQLSPLVRWGLPILVVGVLGWIQLRLWYGVGMVPLGAVVAWPIALEVPPGWHVCTGATVDAPDELRQRLLGTFGNESPPPGKIKLPDYRGYFLRGSGGVDPDQNRKFDEKQADMVHLGDLGGNQVFVFKNRLEANLANFRVAPWSVMGIEDHNITPYLGVETRPKNYSVQWIMRIK